jgi:MinD superfamily P-loop ATPase
MENKFDQIAITGGKGGTGKSTVAVLLANNFIKKGKKVVLADCDVECPDDYLLVNQKLEKPEKMIYAEFPELIKEKCKKCGLCVQTCRDNAIFQKPGEYPVFIHELCSGCGACWAVCPYGAIRPKKEKVGEIFVNEIKDNFWLITGDAKAGLEETGPVVTDLKEFAIKFSKEKEADVLLLDTAAGTHCPVISALLGSDLAYAVTEPTPMGATDLELILDLCKKLEIPNKVILNQSDMGDEEKVKKVMEKYNIEIERKIPYLKEVSSAYSKGKLLEVDLIDKS